MVSEDIEREVVWGALEKLEKAKWLMEEAAEKLSFQQKTTPSPGEALKGLKQLSSQLWDFILGMERSYGEEPDDEEVEHDDGEVTARILLKQAERLMERAVKKLGLLDEKDSPYDTWVKVDDMKSELRKFIDLETKSKAGQEDSKE